MSEEPATYHGRRLEWNEIAQPAATLFRVWHDGTELEWAERAWAMLAAAGLTEYGDDLGLTRVKVRLLALATFYRDFCKIGCDEGYDENAFMWEEGGVLDFSTFRLGQLAGPTLEAGDMEAEDSDLSESALLTLTADERPAICRALVTACGGTTQLAEALFATSRREWETDSEDEDPHRDLFDESPSDAGRVVEWIENGMTNL